MRIRRCAIVFFEPREEVSFDLHSLLGGGAGLASRFTWVAVAAHLDKVVEVSTQERELLGAIGSHAWIELPHQVAAERQKYEALIDKGLLVVNSPDNRHYLDDEKVRAAHWWPLAALMHRSSRWTGVDAVRTTRENGLETAAGLIEKLGAPPPAVSEKFATSPAISLARTPDDPHDTMLKSRVTCRNFDVGAHLSFDDFSLVMQRVFAAHASATLDQHALFLKKNVPSAGGLHSTSAYVVAQRIASVSPGVYHYNPVSHALEAVACAPMHICDSDVLQMLAGQHWFASAPALIILAPRFRRCFWKYRNHSKAYRALLLDAGHLSQALYAAATQQGLAAFVTSAINEREIEKLCGMDSLEESPVAICGFGHRAERLMVTEFDPGRTIWRTE